MIGSRVLLHPECDAQSCISVCCVSEQPAAVSKGLTERPPRLVMLLDSVVVFPLRGGSFFECRAITGAFEMGLD